MSSIGGGRWLTEGDPDELIQCPFDPVHLLRRKRMPYHIIKCGKVRLVLNILNIIHFDCLDKELR